MRKVTVVLGMMFVVACGGGSGGFHTSVPGSTPLAGLSDTQVKTICKDVQTYVEAQFTRETQCRALGAAFASLSAGDPNTTDAELQQACAGGYALCLSTPPDADAGAPDDSCATAMKPGAACTATVAQYEACVNESFGGLKNAFPPCNQLTKSKLAMLSGDAGTATGPACAAFEAACPEATVSTTTGALKAR